jgi:hypothetical protein
MIASIGTTKGGSAKRTGGTSRAAADLKQDAPLADLCALGGWKDHNTVLRCYMRPDEAASRAGKALAATCSDGLSSRARTDTVNGHSPSEITKREASRRP